MTNILCLEERGEMVRPHIDSINSVLKLYLLLVLQKSRDGHRTMTPGETKKGESWDGSGIYNQSHTLVLGLSQVDARQSGKISKWAFLYYGMTTTLAVILGIVLVSVIHPGNPSMKDKPMTINERADVSGVDKFLDVVR